MTIKNEARLMLRQIDEDIQSRPRHFAGWNGTFRGLHDFADANEYLPPLRSGPHKGEVLVDEVSNPAAFQRSLARANAIIAEVERLLRARKRASLPPIESVRPRLVSGLLGVGGHYRCPVHSKPPYSMASTPERCCRKAVFVAGSPHKHERGQNPTVHSAHATRETEIKEKGITIWIRQTHAQGGVSHTIVVSARREAHQLSRRIESMVRLLPNLSDSRGDSPNDAGYFTYWFNGPIPKGLIREIEGVARREAKGKSIGALETLAVEKEKAERKKWKAELAERKAERHERGENPSVRSSKGVPYTSATSRKAVERLASWQTYFKGRAAKHSDPSERALAKKELRKITSRASPETRKASAALATRIDALVGKKKR